MFAQLVFGRFHKAYQIVPYVSSRDGGHYVKVDSKNELITTKLNLGYELNWCESGAVPSGRVTRQLDR